MESDDGGPDGPPVGMVWRRLSEELRETMEEAAYQSWVEKLEARDDGAIVTLAAPNRFIADWVQNNLGYQIRTGWARLDPAGRPVEFGVAAAARTARAPHVEAAEVYADAGMDAAAAAPSLRPGRTGSADGDGRTPPTAPEPRRGPAGGAVRECTFENFVAGPSNEFAFSAARAAASDPNPGFNPLFLHGGYGFGKTHLARAILNAVQAEGERTALYYSGERFTSDFCAALAQKGAPAFKAKVRGVDLLIVDDVQMIEGKKSTQEEFFHTVADLVQDGRQVVLTADRPPAELDGMDARVRSLLSGGVRCDIGPADLDLRQRILDRVLTEMTVRHPWLDMSEEARGFLAARVTASPRELLGALNTLVARAAVHKQPMSVEWVTGALAQFVAPQAKRISVDQIQKAVAEYFDLRVAEMLSARRSRNVARPRQIAMYLSKELTTRSYPDLGRRFGGRDHTTVIHGVRRIEALMEEDKQLADVVTSIRRQLEA